MVRFVSGIALVAVALAAILLLPIVALRVLACVVAALAAREYLEIVDSPIRAVVLAVALCWVSSGLTMPAAQLLMLMALLWVTAEVLIADHPIAPATSGVFGAKVYEAARADIKVVASEATRASHFLMHANIST